MVGFTFTVRIQTCVTLLGVVGALGLALLLSSESWNDRFAAIKKYAWFSIIILFFAVLSYAIFMFSIRNLVKWHETMVFYGKNYDITRKLWNGWKPYLLINIWHLTGFPFILFAFLGFAFDCVKWHKLNLPRRWLLICTVGLLASYLKMALPWPRAYLYMIFIMTIYWVLSFEHIFSFWFTSGQLVRMRVPLVLCSLLIMAFCEMILILPFIHKKSRYNDVVAFIENRGAGNLHTTHARPIFSMLSFTHSTYIVYDTYRVNKTYRDFCEALMAGYVEKNVRYMILDNNVSYFGGDDRMLQQFVVTVLPDAVFKNDFGEDFHTCMDAFAAPPKHDIFTDKIMVCDMRNFKKVPRVPIPFYSPKKMDEIFTFRISR